jgi:hypothetical protein
MVDRRRERRSRAELRVQVSGLDASCEDFSERVVATDLSRSGALLKNVDIELRCGEVIAIEYCPPAGLFQNCLGAQFRHARGDAGSGSQVGEVTVPLG